MLTSIKLTVMASFNYMILKRKTKIKCIITVFGLAIYSLLTSGCTHAMVNAKSEMAEKQSIREAKPFKGKLLSEEVLSEELLAIKDVAIEVSEVDGSVVCFVQRFGSYDQEKRKNYEKKVAYSKYEKHNPNPVIGLYADAVNASTLGLVGASMALADPKSDGQATKVIGSMEEFVTEKSEKWEPFSGLSIAIRVDGSDAFRASTNRDGSCKIDILKLAKYASDRSFFIAGFSVESEGFTASKRLTLGID